MLTILSSLSPFFMMPVWGIADLSVTFLLQHAVQARSLHRVGEAAF